VSLTYRALQGDLNFQAEFQEPAFELLRDPIGVQRQLFTRLSRHGVRLVDVRLDRGNGSLGDHSFLCYLFNFAVSVRVGLGGMEIICFDLARVDTNKLGESGVDALGAIKEHAPSVSFKAYTLSVGLHGKLDECPAQEFLSKYAANVPGGLGPRIGNGAVFYYGASASRLMTSVTLDLSASITDGLFVRTQVVWDASKVGIETIPQLSDSHVKEVLGHLDLVTGQELRQP